MTDPRLKDLIHASLDGALDSAEEAELASCLAEDADARAYRDQMAQLVAFMERIPPREPPGDLHREVMDGIRLPRPRRRLAAGFGQLPGFLRYGFAGAMGLLLAMGIYEYRPQQGADSDPSRMVGTIMPDRAGTPAVTLDQGSFALDGASGAVLLQRRNGSLVLDMELEAPAGQVEVRVDYAGATGVAFDSVSQSEGQVDSIELADQAVKILAGGHQKFSVVLDGGAGREDGQIEVSWSSDGKLLKSEALSWSN